MQQSTGGDEKISEQPKTETTAEQPKTDAAQANGPGQSVGDAAKTEGASTTSKVESKAPESKELQEARAYMKKKDEELAKKLADLKGAGFLKKTEVLSKFIKACFDDKVFRKNAALVAKAENYTLMKSDEIKIVQLNAKGLPVLGAMRKQQFLHADGSTDKVAAEYYDQYGKDGKNICSQDFADSTLTFGGIFQNWTTQEEVLFRQAGLAMFGALFQDGHELTEPRGLKEYVYTRNEATGRPNVETFTGCILNGRQDRVDNDTLPNGPIPMKYLLTAAPSLSTDKKSFDPHNDIACTIEYRVRVRVPGESEPDKAGYDNGIAMMNAVYAQKAKVKNGKVVMGFDGKPTPVDRYDDDTKCKMLKILMCSTEVDLFNIKDDSNRKRVLDKLAADIKAGRMDGLLKEIDDKRYPELLQRRFDKWAKLCAASHVDYLIGGPIGTGAFNNKPMDIARAMARAWAKYGNGDYVYAQFKHGGDEDKVADTFRKEFEEAQRLKVKLLQEDGYEIKEIVASLKEGGYNRDEIADLLAYGREPSDAVAIMKETGYTVSEIVSTFVRIGVDDDSTLAAALKEGGITATEIKDVLEKDYGLGTEDVRRCFADAGFTRGEVNAVLG